MPIITLLILLVSQLALCGCIAPSGLPRWYLGPYLKATCASISQPNPMVTAGNQTTGTFNGTRTILPISLDRARKIIPPQTPILTEAYQALLPGFPADMYPAVLIAGVNHDLKQNNKPSIPDYLQAEIIYPFVDALKNGRTPFAYSAVELYSEGSSRGTTILQYGAEADPAIFAPVCDAYSAGNRPSTTSFFAQADGYPSNYVPSLSSTYDVGPEQKPEWLNLDFFINVSNQPRFFPRSTDKCAKYNSVWNTTISQGGLAPKFIVGNVTVGLPMITMPMFQFHMNFTGAYGVAAGTGITNEEFVDCAKLA